MMLGIRLFATLLAGSAMLIGDPVQAAGSSRRAGYSLPFAEPDGTASVALGTLSVKPLGVDRPWDPRVCIGCDRNNGSPFDKKLRLGHRAR